MATRVSAAKEAPALPASVRPHLCQVRNRSVHAGDILINKRAGFDLARRLVRNEILAERRQRHQQVIASPT